MARSMAVSNHLWRLLGRLGENSSHYAIGDISPLRPLFGDAVVEAFREAMIEYWRLLHTALPSEVPPEERTSSAYDLLGIVGVTLEAANNPGWAAALNEEEAKLATRFATRELNGFPKWIDDLAAAHPAIVKDTLWHYLSGRSGADQRGRISHPPARRGRRQRCSCDAHGAADARLARRASRCARQRA